MAKEKREIVALKCEICGNKMVRTLEVHHIRPREEAKGAKHFADGSARDAVANLAVLCEKAATGVNDDTGIVTCPAGITDTMGGKQGISPEGGTSLGTFAKKVLMK